MKRFLSRVFSTDVGLTVLLVSLVLVLFVIYPFVPLGATGRRVVTLGLTLILISGSFSLRDRPRLGLVIIGLAAVAFFGQASTHMVDHPILQLSTYLSTLLFLGLTAAGLLARVFRPGRITAQRIQGAVAVYLLLGLIWGFAYSLLELERPGSFELSEPLRPDNVSIHDEHMRHLVYFSFVTLTTVGYGDVTPVSAGARTLAMLEALLGQLYLVILIARLVSLHNRPLELGSTSRLEAASVRWAPPPAHLGGLLDL